MEVASYVNDWDEQVFVCKACHEANGSKEVSRILNDGMIDPRSFFKFRGVVNTGTEVCCAICEHTIK